MNLTAAQKKSVIVATIIVGAVMILIAVLTKVSYGSAMPAPPTLDTALHTDTMKARIDNYKALSEVVLKEKTFLYDAIVVKILEPLFTKLLAGIIGFIFLADTLKALAGYISARAVARRDGRNSE